MFHGRKVDNHAPHPRGRCHVEVVALAAEAGMTMPMNMRPEWIRFKELTQRVAPDVSVVQSGIQNAHRRTVRNEDCLQIEMGTQISEIDSDVAVRFFESATHKGQGVLITNEPESSTTYGASVDRLNKTGTGIQLDEVVIPHDV